MPHGWSRSLLALLFNVLLISPNSGAFDFPLSDTAVRSAYFLGQRHDISMAQFLDRYTRHLRAPKTGPYISSITLRTPYSQVVEYSNLYIGNLSAQQVELDHRQATDTVRVIAGIELTPSYGPFVSSDGTTVAFNRFGAKQRSSDFWRDFNVIFLEGNSPRNPVFVSGRPNFYCSEGGNCILAGASIEFDFQPESLMSDTLTVQITPPEGDLVFVDFPLDSLR